MKLTFIVLDCMYIDILTADSISDCVPGDAAAQPRVATRVRVSTHVLPLTRVVRLQLPHCGRENIKVCSFRDKNLRKRLGQKSLCVIGHSSI